MSSTYRVYGIHAVRAVLAARPQGIVSAVILAGDRNAQLESLAGQIAAAGAQVRRTGRHELDRLADGGVHQGVVLEVRAPQPLSVTDLEERVLARGSALLLLVLDGVEDPRNLGACLRTADAAGVDAVIVPRSRSAGLTPAALKVATGAAETVPVVEVPNLARVLRWLQSVNVRVVGADADGATPLYQSRLGRPLALVLGSEGRGLRRLTREHCDELVHIPMQGSVGSLNVSVAAAIVLFEAVRQAGGPDERRAQGV
jgi:23S rRNA (guanosine2251-2'-O)-methyltransferase